MKYLDEHHKTEPVKKITCYLLDREQAWADTWTEFDESLCLDIHLNNVFQPLDVTDPESWKSQRKFLQADLFSMSYFVSEVFSLDHSGIVTKFWAELFTNAKPGALFLYIDNGHSDFNTYFDERWQSAGLELLIGRENTRLVPRYSERASDLGMR